MSNAAQNKAVKNYRARLAQRGFKRFELMALVSDRGLLRSLARRLAEEGPEAEHARASVKALVAEETPKPGGMLAALRRLLARILIYPVRAKKVEWSIVNALPSRHQYY